MTGHPRQQLRSDIIAEVGVFESPSEAWDVLGIVSFACPGHGCCADPFEEEVVEIWEHGDEECQSWDAGFDEPQLQGAEGFSDWFKTSGEGSFLEPTHTEGYYG